MQTFRELTRKLFCTFLQNGDFCEIWKSSSPEPLGQFKSNLAQGILGWLGLKFVQMKVHALFGGEIFTKRQKYVEIFLKKHWANFKQTWQKG